MTTTDAIPADERALEALAHAFDKEDAAQRGEPDPWRLPAPGDDLDDYPEWRAERIGCAKAAIEAYFASRAPVDGAEPAAWQRYSERLGWTIVGADFARVLMAGGEIVRPLYPPAPAASPACGGEVIAKPLEWRGPDLDDEYYARSIIGTFVIGYCRKDGYRWCMGKFHPSLDAAKAAAQADYERRIRSALVEAQAPTPSPDAELVRTLRSALQYARNLLGPDEVIDGALSKHGGGR